MRRLPWIFFALLIALSTICSGEELPGTVAVMPFSNETEEANINSVVRKSFYNHFSSKPYRDVELNVVDEKVVRLEKSTGKPIAQIDAREISAAIGCDGLIFGRVTDFKKIFAAVYSQLSVELEVWMINTKTNAEVFRFKESVTYHGGSIPTTPLGVLMTAVSAAMNIRDIQQVRLINELSYKLNEKIPSPEGVAAQEVPLIKEVLTNVKESPFGKGKMVKVGLEGEKGLVATFDIGNFKRGILMKESNPGIYVGEYLTLPGDNVKEMPVIVSLKRPGGGENQWVNVDGFVTIDTTPPPRVTGLKAKGFNDHIEVAWAALANIPDLKGYRVLRSEHPLSGYQEVAVLELTSYEDRTISPGITYYYRVTGLDTANNESDPQDGVKASLASVEPVKLAGELKKDTLLSGNYIVTGEVVVPKDISLTIEGGTRIAFQEATGLSVRGKLVVEGKETPVEFGPIGDNKWKGLSSEGGSVMIRGARIKGAGSAISASNSEGIIENGIITGNETGIFIAGSPSIAVKNSTISGNHAAMVLEKTNARVTGNSVFQNRVGIVLKGFSGELRENNIYDNERNISSESEVRVDPNYLGSMMTDEMRISGVTLSKVYDDRLPQGKIAEPVSNPYTQMTQAERGKKAAELASQAGDYFKQRNFGRASTRFEESIKAAESAEAYYYLALCHQEMKEGDKALSTLRKGAEKFPQDPGLRKAMGLIYYEAGNEAEALKAFQEVVRLNPGDKQVKFLLERMQQK